MIRRAAVILAVAFLLALAVSYSRASEYPTVRELEAGLGYAPGSPLKELLIGGRRVLIFYVHSKAVGNGIYDVRVKLR